MIRGLFITGTDTGVGKTVVSAAVMHRYRKQSPLRYWKPIQTGIECDDDTAIVGKLGNCHTDEIFAEGVRLQHPVSPHLAAKLSGRRITIQQLNDCLISADDSSRAWIIEGAGGVLVPINESEQMLDLIRMLNVPVLIVANTRLGTINHTLLTIEALRRRALIVTGIVMVGLPNADNREAIELHGLVPVLGELPHLPQLNSQSLSRWSRNEFDRDSLLLDFMRLVYPQRLAMQL